MAKKNARVSLVVVVYPNCLSISYRVQSVAGIRKQVLVVVVVVGSESRATVSYAYIICITY